VHTDITENLLEACRRLDIPQLLQITALNANKSDASYYLNSKNAAEAILLATKAEESAKANQNGKATSLPKVTIIRPSVIFGPRDSFTNRFHTLLKFAPPIFPLAMGHTRLQPIYVGDVVNTILKILQNPQVQQEAFDIAGPEILTLKEIVEYIAKLTGYRTKILALGGGLSAIQANIMQYCPGKPFSRDNLRSLQVESICTDENGLSQLDIIPTSMDSIVPGYLAKKSSRFAYYKFRDRT
jgi:NADH dehydrogenase